jgi:hypothetical protein
MRIRIQLPKIMRINAAPVILVEKRINIELKKRGGNLDISTQTG